MRSKQPLSAAAAAQAIMPHASSSSKHAAAGRILFCSARELRTNGGFGCSVRLGGTASLQKQRAQRLIFPARTEPSATTAFGVSYPARRSGA